MPRLTPSRTRLLLSHPIVRRYRHLVREDLGATYARHHHKWLLVAPLVGVVTGLFITGLTEVMLVWLWPAVLALYEAHPLLMPVGLVAGFVVAGLLMQYATPNPDEHSTEEIIEAYHQRSGLVRVRAFVPKILAAITSVGMGGSAALEGPSIYGGGAIGSALFDRLRRFPLLRLTPRDRRIMLISGAAAGMAAVFRAPLTGIVFALEMPYKDDLAHEALVPSLLSSVVSYATMAALIGAEPLFGFVSGDAARFGGRELLLSALLGGALGLVAMTFAITFRRFRVASVHLRIPHWAKMALGGGLTSVVGLAFLSAFPGTLLPIGPNYEAVTEIIAGHHGWLFLVAFAVAKLVATLFSLGSGGVSAMFVPLFLSGGALGVAFSEVFLDGEASELFAAVGMASFIAAGYKAPLTAVVFIAEATGGHGFVIPALIGAACAYAVSGEASASGAQRLHEARTRGEGAPSALLHQAEREEEAALAEGPEAPSRPADQAHDEPERPGEHEEAVEPDRHAHDPRHGQRAVDPIDVVMSQRG